MSQSAVRAPFTTPGMTLSPPSTTSSGLAMRAALLPAGLSLPATPGIRVILLAGPTPRTELAALCQPLANTHRWLGRVPARDWLPS